MMCVNVNEISVESDKKWEFSPKIPIVKIAHFGNVMSTDDFYKGGRKYLSFVGSSWNFVSDYIKKNVDAYHVSFS